MPEMDGFQTASMLKIRKKTKDIPIIMVTGRDDVQSISRAYEAGATDFIAKPFKWMILIERIRNFYRTELDTGRTPRAALLDNVSWFFDQGNREFTGLSFHPLDFGVGQNLDIGMPAAFNEFRTLDAHGAVIGGKGLVELGHLAANGRGFVHQENLETRFGKIESGLDAADSSADDCDPHG